MYVIIIEFVKTAIYDNNSMMSAQEPMSSAFCGQGRRLTTEMFQASTLICAYAFIKANNGARGRAATKSTV